MKKTIPGILLIAGITAVSVANAIVSDNSSSEQNARCTPYPECRLRTPSPEDPIIKELIDEVEKADKA